MCTIKLSTEGWREIEQLWQEEEQKQHGDRKHRPCRMNIFLWLLLLEPTLHISGCWKITFESNTETRMWNDFYIRLRMCFWERFQAGKTCIIYRFCVLVSLQLGNERCSKRGEYSLGSQVRCFSCWGKNYKSPKQGANGSRMKKKNKGERCLLPTITHNYIV